MDWKATTARSDLEQMLVDETAEPKALPLSLLEDITRDFSDSQEIGSGGFAIVYKGILGLGHRAVAVKRLSNTYMHEKQFHREVECLMHVKHKNVVRFLGYCADTQGSMERYDGKLVMADVQQRLLCFEYVPNGSLDKYIIDPCRAWRTCYKIIKGICAGLQYLHENNIIHLDMKPANILLDNNMIPKVTDFGLSRCFAENQTREITKNIFGSIGYLAPEVREGGVIARSADLYSLGVIITEILNGHKGYQDIGDVLESWSGRLEGSQRNTLCEQIQQCYEIAIECREFNPSKRPASVRDIIDRLNARESVKPIQDNTVHMATINNWTPISLSLKSLNQHWQVRKEVSSLENSNQQLVEQNNQLLNQIAGNIKTFKTRDNMSLFHRTSNNIKTILDSETPGIMGMMPPPPGIVQEDKLHLLLRAGKTKQKERDGGYEDFSFFSGKRSDIAFLLQRGYNPPSR